MKPKLILDTKSRSPFGWKADYSWHHGFEFANNNGDIVAVHSMPEFGGSDELVDFACQEAWKPILVKGIHRTDDEIQKYLGMGADYVLVVGRIPTVKAEYLNKCLLEPTCIAEIMDYPWGMKIVWNERNLVTGLPKVESFEEAYKKCNHWVCQASMIESIDDINPDADAIMVGTNMHKIVKELNG